MLEIITGSLLDAKEKYILHQTNAISTGKAFGLAKDIFDKYPYADCYADRTETSKPGTIDIRGNGKDNRYIINVHGQLYPGKCRYSQSNLDGLVARKTYFYHGLLRVSQLHDLESIALPWRISCGLAGGDWEWTLGTIGNMALFLEKQNVKVRIYKRVGDE